MGSLSKVSVNAVVVTVPDVPLAFKLMKETIVDVTGNTEVTTPELALFDTVDVPATVKKFASAHARVKPVLAISVIVAV